MDKTKLYNYYNITIRLVIIIISTWFLYNELSSKNIEEYKGVIESLLVNNSFIYITIIVLLLMPVNWSLEALKWRYILSTKEEISFPLALKAIFAGASVSAISPNRMGDFFGRIFVLKKMNFFEGVFVTLIGSFAQTLISLIFGFIAYIWLYTSIENAEPLYKLIAVIFAILIPIIIFSYFKISILHRFIPSRWTKSQNYIKVLSNYKTNQLLIVLLFSFTRYAIFSTQFALMIYVVGLHIPISHLFFIVSIIFFINMLRPSIALLEFAMRGIVSVEIIRVYYSVYLAQEVPDNNIIIASTLIWFINIIIPSAIGLLFIKDLSFFRIRNKNK